MKKYLYSIALLGFVLSPAFVFADYTITTTVSASNALGSVYSGGGRTFYAQPATTTGAGTVQIITVGVKNPSGADNATITIRPDIGGLPDFGTSLGSDTITPITASCSSDNTFDMGTPVSLSANTQYWFVLTSNSSTPGNLANCGDSSSGGAYSDAGGNENATARYEMIVSEGGGGGGETASSTDYGSATTTNYMLQNINFALAIVLVFMGIGFTGYIWNSFSQNKKKPWK